MMDFNEALAALEADSLPAIEAARKHLCELQDTLKARTHELAVEHGYTNAVIEALKAGQSVFVHHYHDGECCLYVGQKMATIYFNVENDYSSSYDELSISFIEAIEYGLIVEGEMDDRRNIPFTLTPLYPL